MILLNEHVSSYVPCNILSICKLQVTKHDLVIYFHINLGLQVSGELLRTMAASPPPNFSWVEPHRLAGLGMPRMTAHYQFLLNNGIKHLVTLSERMPPYHDTCPELISHHIRIHDFCAPTFDQIKRFLSIVEEANSKGEVKKIQSIIKN